MVLCVFDVWCQLPFPPPAFGPTTAVSPSASNQMVPGEDLFHVGRILVINPTLGSVTTIEFFRLFESTWLFSRRRPCLVARSAPTSLRIRQSILVGGVVERSSLGIGPNRPSTSFISLMWFNCSQLKTTAPHNGTWESVPCNSVHNCRAYRSHH